LPGPQIRIGDRKALKDVALDPLHCLGVLFPHVIVSQEVQETVHGKVGDMMNEWLAFGARFPRNGFKRQNDVADERRLAPGAARRERQDVRGGIDPAPGAVEQADSRIIGQYDSKLRARC
jgi:hypothetical protein